MKKTIVALAVLAASGASFAQVSITGKLGFSFQKNAAAPDAAQGMQMTDGDLNFAATEDLGGGMAITAKSAFASRGRDNTFAARDASLTLVTGAGAFILGSVESCSIIDNVAGAPVSVSTAHDGVGAPLEGSCTNIDTAVWVLPVGPITAKVAYSEFGPGAGLASTVSTWTLGGTYAAGPLSATLDYTTYAANETALNGTGLATLLSTGRSNVYTGNVGTAGTYYNGLGRTRLAASYDLGVVKLGAGLETKTHNTANVYSVSASAPVGSAVSVGLTYTSRAEQTADATYLLVGDTARTATGLGMTYMLSKTANVNVSYATYTGAPTTGNGKNLSNEYRIRLLKSF